MFIRSNTTWANFHINLVDTALANEIRKALETDEIGQAVIRKQIPRLLKSDRSEWTYFDGLVQYMGRCYVPDATGLRQKVIRSIHESPTTGHPGRFKSVELIKRDYWWPNMTKTIATWIADWPISHWPPLTTQYAEAAVP